MRTPRIAKNIETAKSLALDLWKSKDWRFQFLAYYVLNFYLTPPEIMDFLRVRPKIIREFKAALPKIRKDPKLIRLNSLKAVLEIEETRKVPRKRTEIEYVLGV